MVRIGKVSQLNTEKQTVQVLFEDLDQTTSNDLPILYPHTSKNKVAKMPEINEEVVCIFLESNSDGFCLGTFFTEGNSPDTKEHFTFSDGTVLEYDTVTHHLKADVKGTVTLKGENIILNGQTTLEGNVILRGTITLEGDLNVTGATTLATTTIQGDVSFGGGVNCPDKCTCTP